MAFFRYFIISSLVLSSCQYFDTEKISSDEIFEEEIKSINWNEVDSYPLFENCDESVEKPEQRDCFTNTLSSAIYQRISEENLVVSRDLLDTIKIDFQVKRSGELLISRMEIDSLFKTEFPNLEQQIFKALDSVQPIAPAYKRGIPVETHFSLPIILRTD